MNVCSEKILQIIGIIFLMAHSYEIMVILYSLYGMQDEGRMPTQVLFRLKFK